MRAGRWEKKRFVGTELYNHTRGIVGLGRIGSIVAERALRMKMRVLAYDPYVAPDTAAKAGVEMVPLPTLFRKTDYITIHTPLTTETEALIGEPAFKKMKKGVRIINCARGGLIDEAALYEAIKTGKVAGAALDVFAAEPPASSPLSNVPWVLSMLR